MDPRDELLADTQRKFAEFADRLTLEEQSCSEAESFGDFCNIKTPGAGN